MFSRQHHSVAHSLEEWPMGQTVSLDLPPDLARRAADEMARASVRRSAARLRAAGIRVVTLAAEDDAVVTPEDALLPSDGPDASAFVLRPRRRPGASYVESMLGHGALPHDPLCWQRVLAALGPAVEIADPSR